MVMEARVVAEKKDIDYGLTLPNSSIGIAFYGRQRTSCELSSPSNFIPTSWLFAGYSSCFFKHDVCFCTYTSMSYFMSCKAFVFDCCLIYQERGGGTEV